MSGSKDSPKHRYPRRSSRSQQSRSSDRLKRKSFREFVLPDKAEILANLVPEGTSPSKSSRDLRPRRLVNDFVKERNRYNNPDGIDLFDDDPLLDFVVDNGDEDDEPQRSKRRKKKKGSSESEWEESDDAEYSEGSVVSESDDILDNSPESEASIDSEDEDGEPAVRVTSSDQDESDSDAESVSSTEEFMSKRVKKSLKKLPKRVTSSTWWKTNKGPLSSNTKKRRSRSRTQIEESDDSDDSDEVSSRPSKHRQRRSTSSDDSDEEPSCSNARKRSQRVKSDRVRTRKNSGSVEKRVTRSKVKRTPVIVEEHDSEEDDDISPVKQKSRQRVRPQLSIIEEEVKPQKTKAKRKSYISSSEDSNDDDDNASPDNQEARQRVGSQPVNSVKEKTERKRNRPSHVISSDESDNETIILESSTGKSVSTGKEKDNSSTDSDVECPRSAKRHRIVLVDDDDEMEEEEQEAPGNLEEEMNTSDDLGNVDTVQRSSSHNSKECASTKPGAMEQCKTDPTCSEAFDNNKAVEPTNITDMQSKESEVREQRGMETSGQHLEGLESGAKESASNVSANRVAEQESGRPVNEQGSTSSEKDVVSNDVAKLSSEVTMQDNCGSKENNGVDDTVNKSNENSKDTTSNLAPGDSVVPVKAEEKLVSKVDDYDSDDSVVECEVPPKTPPPEITLSSDEETPIPPTSNPTNTQVTSASSLFTFPTQNTYNSSNARGGFNIFSNTGTSYGQNAFQQSQPGGFSLGVNTGNNHVQQPTTRTTFTFNNQAANIPNYSTTNQFGNRMQQTSMFNRSNTRTGFPTAGANAAYPTSGGFSTTGTNAGFPTTGANAAYPASGGFPTTGTNVGFPTSGANAAFCTAVSNAGFPTSGANAAFCTAVSNAGFQTTGANASFPTRSVNTGFPTTSVNTGFTTTDGASASFPTTHANSGTFNFQAQGHPSRGSRGWAQMPSNNQTYQSANRPQMTGGNIHRQSFQNAQTANRYNNTGLSTGAQDNHSNFQAVNRMQMSSNSTQYQSFANAGNRTGGAQTTDVNSAASLPQFQQSFSSRSQMPVRPTWATTTATTSTTGGFSFGTNTRNGQVQAITPNFQTGTILQGSNNPVLRTLLKTDIASNTTIMRNNGMNMQQFQTPNGLQMPRAAAAQNYQAVNRFQSAGNYVQPSSFSDAGGVANTTSRKNGLSNYQTSPFGIPANNMQQQSRQSSSGMGNSATCSVGRIQNYQMMNGTEGQGSSAQFQSVSATGGSQSYATNHQFSNRTQTSSGQLTHIMPNMKNMGPAVHAGMIGRTPNCQSLNGFQKSFNSVQPQAPSTINPGGNNIMGNVQNSQPVDRFQMSGGSAQPQSLENVATRSVVGSARNNQPLDRLKMFTNSIQQQTANVTQRGIMNSAANNLSPNAFQLPGNSIQAQNLPNDATLPAPFSDALNYLAQNRPGNSNTTQQNTLNEGPAGLIGSAENNSVLNGYQILDNNVQVQQQTVPNITPMDSVTTALHHHQPENNVKTPGHANQQTLPSITNDCSIRSGSVVQPLSSWQTDDIIAAGAGHSAADANLNDLFTASNESCVALTNSTQITEVPVPQSIGFFGDSLSPVDNTTPSIDIVVSEEQTNAPSSISAVCSQAVSITPRDSNANEVNQNQSNANVNGAQENPADETDGVCLASVEDQSSAAKSGIPSKETLTEYSPDIPPKETMTECSSVILSEETMSGRPPVCEAPTISSGCSSRNSCTERSQGIVNSINADVTVFKQPVGKPVVILRDILSQIKSVKFSEASRATRHNASKSRIQIQPGKRFLIKEKNDENRLNIIDQNTDTTIVVEGRKDFYNNRETTRLKSQSRPNSMQGVDKSCSEDITNGFDVVKCESIVNSKESSEQVNGHSEFPTGQHIETADDRCVDVDNTASKTTHDIMPPGGNDGSKQMSNSPITSDNNNERKLLQLPQSQPGNDNQQKNMLEILPVV